MVGAAELEEQRRRDQAKKFLRAVKSTGRGNAEALQLLTMLIQLGIYTYIYICVCVCMYTCVSIQ